MAFQGAVHATFAAFGIDAVYTPPGGDPVSVRVIARRPDTIVGFGETRIHAETAIFEVRWHFQPGGGPEFCKACRENGLPCARGETGAEGRLCPYREHALISRQEHEAWEVLLACQGEPERCDPNRLVWSWIRGQGEFRAILLPNGGDNRSARGAYVRSAPGSPHTQSHW